MITLRLALENTRQKRRKAEIRRSTAVMVFSSIFGYHSAVMVMV
jgi:hypothetical protein